AGIGIEAAALPEHAVRCRVCCQRHIVLEHAVVARICDVYIAAVIDVHSCGGTKCVRGSRAAESGCVASTGRVVRLPKHPVCHRVCGEWGVILEHPAVGKWVDDIEVTGGVHTDAARSAEA